MNWPTPKNKIIFTLLYIFLFLLFIIRSANLTKIPAKDLLLLHTKLFYPHPNKFHMGAIGKINTQILFLLLLLYTLPLCIIIHYPDTSKYQKTSILSRKITIAWISCFLIIAIIQQMSRAEYAAKNLYFLKKIHNGEKYLLFLGKPLAPTIYLKKRLKDCHRCKVLTDLKKDRDPYLFYFNALSYYLYPQLSLKYPNNAPNDCILLFYKNNPSQSIPANFHIIYNKSTTFICALKDDNRHN